MGGHRLHRNTQLAELVLKQIIELEPRNSDYVLRQIFTLQVINGMRAADTRSRTSQQGMKKIPGCSWIEVNGVVHELLVGDKSHALSDKIYAKLHELAKELKAAGYVPTTDFVYCWDIEEE
ncbi:unnamed protein product [Malus baccata var. baccata]